MEICGEASYGEGVSPERNDANTTADPRPERTRRLLADALGSITAEGTADPSVTDIVARAGVNRSSFYAHFSTTGELALYALREVFETISRADFTLRTSAGVTGKSAAWKALASVVDHASGHAALLRMYTVSAPGETGLAAIAALLARNIADFTSAFAPELSAAESQATAIYVSHGLTGLLSAWLSGALECTRDELVDLMVAQLPEYMASRSAIPAPPSDTTTKEGES